MHLPHWYAPVLPVTRPELYPVTVTLLPSNATPTPPASVPLFPVTAVVPPIVRMPHRDRRHARHARHATAAPAAAESGGVRQRSPPLRSCRGHGYGCQVAQFTFVKLLLLTSLPQSAPENPVLPVTLLVVVPVIVPLPP